MKIGATSITADWTRVEARTYASLQGSFLPDVLGFDDDGERPILALEDLSAATWPPPWSDAAIAAVLDALARIQATPPPRHLAPETVSQGAGWGTVSADPSAFLALRVCAPSWLRAALPVLIEAAAGAPLGGDTLVHFDLRSDNLCLRDDRAVVIDWNHAALANPDVDLAFWLPSLASEGGPPPESLLPDSPGLAAWTAGFFCARAGLPAIPDAPHVRPLQLAQARTALPWAARALGLPPPVPG